MLPTDQLWFAKAASEEGRENGRRRVGHRLMHLLHNKVFIQNHHLQQFSTALQKIKG